MVIKLQTDKCDVKSAIEFVEKWGESALEYSPTPEYQQRLRSLYGQFVYRLILITLKLTV